ncbi:MAG: IPT/TIG domain-containing protein [Patescibacteria group bacterium]
MKPSRFTRLLLGLALATAFGLGIGGPEAWAQSAEVAVEGLTTVGDATGLGSEDPRVIVAKIIRGALGFLGIIGVIILLYGGFVWMTAGGEAEKVARAKKIIINAGIGVAVILFSLAITQFILGSLIKATGGGSGTVVDDGSGGSGLGGSTSSAFIITKHTPVGEVAIRNVVPQITFSKALSEATITSANISFAYADGAEIPGTLTVVKNRVSFVPATPCPAPNEDRFCFEPGVVNVRVKTGGARTGVKSDTGVNLSCANNLCVSSFVAGDLIDTEAPNAELELPDDGAGVSSESLVPVQVSATDDSQVAGADFAASDIIFDTIPATGDDLSDVLIETWWDTAGLQNGSAYRVTATVTDIAGNTDADSITVSMRPATCFDTIMNGIETGLNCGGDSASPNYCGACDGSSCSANDECTSGMCTSGVCVSLPRITAVTPNDGAPGTWVTLSGTGFGSATGKVFFTGGSGQVEAGLAPCADGWTNTQIIAVVPVGAVDGEITLQTAGGLSESTFDDNGVLIADFDVNDVNHPGLCAVRPTFGASNDAVSLEGNGFGAEQGAGSVLFGVAPAGSYTSWSDTGIDVTVPVAVNGSYPVSVSVAGITSNAVNFTVVSETLSAPFISSLTPDSGAAGQYVTISGTNFGSGTGTVWFENIQSQERVLSDTQSFPAACTGDLWSDQSITVIVPKGLGALGNYNVIVGANGQESNAVSFNLNIAPLTPGLCAVKPGNAEPGDMVTLYGDNFGDTSGRVAFSRAAEGTIQSWTDSEVTVAVPTGSVTGPLLLQNESQVNSNPINFEVGGSEVAPSVGQTAAYAWTFSSGNIPDAPQIITECSDKRVSAVPNDQFDNSPGVCVNASVFAEFTLDMSQSTLTATTIEECVAGGNDPCASTVAVPGTFETTSRSVKFLPLVDLKTSTTYKVSVTNTLLSAEGAPLANPKSWTFKTREDQTRCRLSNVLVVPDEATITELNGTRDFAAVPVNGCMVLNDDYSWRWSVDPSYANFDTTSQPTTCAAGNSTCALVRGLAEGETPVRAIEVASNVRGESDLTIDFSDPYVTNYWPNCTQACVNAEVGASFNTAMLQTSLQTAGAVRLYACANELCTNLQPVSGTQIRCTLDANGSCTGFRLNNLSLTPLRYYRVIIDGDVQSTSGVGLTRTNYAGDYSWTFRVREDATMCAVDRIAVFPGEVVVNQVGDQQAFAGEAYGEADSCSVSGQRLSGFTYAWDWTNPIQDEDLDNDSSTRVAEWANNVLVDTNISTIAPGCTASCTATGSQPQTAICGDGKMSFGEECEDGNVANGDGCSASCLREGSSAPSCGNGNIQRQPNGAGEDCDDGNLVNGDGCSATCLAEGSSAIGATCGNKDVAIADELTLAGEECDDGNSTRGDGCSNECLLEGSPTLTEIGGAVCGDGKIEYLAEECDDSNIASGDGCSNRCLWEGSTTTCGINGVQYGEACDDGNQLSGDGCSASCLREGSSNLYSSPSFCGDGIPGVGELAFCERGAQGDGKIDPLQVAVVPTSAVREVDPNTQQAVATIQVSEVSSGLSTQATLALLCSAQNDTQCTDSANYGVGNNSCCLARPTVQFSPRAADVCRNTAMYAVFTDEMALDSFEYEVTEGGVPVTKPRMYVRLDLASAPGGVCPADHTTLAMQPRNLALRIWGKLVRLVSKSARAAQGDCVVPIGSINQTQIGVNKFKVQLHAEIVLIPNGAYTLVVEGDENVLDAETTGVLSEYGVGINGLQTQAFTTGTEICALDAVSVVDTDAASPYLFTRGEEQHVFSATAVAHVNGAPQEIESVDGAYSWSWRNWEAEENGEIVAVAQVEAALNTATVTAAGENGDDAVLVTALIENNTAGVAGPESVLGSAPVVAFLCENPWPGIFSQLPWSDTAHGDIGAELGGGWMNFSTMYCKDSGLAGTVGDLPDVTVVRPPVTESANVIKEYLFEVGGSSDAIGIRVVSNPGYLSPEAWYAAQGFTGNITQTEVGGYKAAKDGRTTYVVAPNQSDDGTLYANVYVISYNEGANDRTIDIYNQILDNLTFAVNVDDVTVCTDAESDCASAREYLRRDVGRLTDMTDIRGEVMAYKAVNGVVPTLPSGTFVRALSSSVWESWRSILGGALEAGDLAADPINDYVSCGDGTYGAYDTETCVDELKGTYICPVDSQAYHYKAVGDQQAFIYADLEYTTGTWSSPIEVDAADGVTISIGNSSATATGFDSAAFCSGLDVYGLSTSCGDGVVGSDEVCELGQLGGTAIACTTAAGMSGTRSQVCNNSCSGFVDNTAAVCVVASCGNGVVEPEAGEKCDDGSYNGVYGFCGSDCNRASAFYCGDGKIAGGEVCDCGVTLNMSYADSRAFQAGPGSCGGRINGTYTASPNGSCAWNCAGSASYCGDGTVDAGEVCDGTDETWDGKLCAASSPINFRNQPCTTDAQCGGGTCGGNGNREVCPVGTTRVRTCDDAPGASCTYTYQNWSYIACTEIGSCGDGQIDPGEACDDGNTDGTDSCTDQCTVNVCGDGYVNAGIEQCDEGTGNGDSCDSAYGSSCTACSLSCRYEVSSGQFCGDGVRNGGEYCDGNDMPYTWYKAATKQTNGSCTVPNAVSPTDASYVCKNVGVCNGGGVALNGKTCLNSADCGGAACVKPTCSQSCGNTCPLTYTSVSMPMVTNQPGAQVSEIAEFFSYVEGTTVELPNAATITVPACNVATDLTATVSLAGVDLPTTYVMFVTDLSLSMKNEVSDNTLPEFGEKTRLQIAQEAIPDAVEELFNKFGSDTKIGLIGYRGLVKGQCFHDSKINCLVAGVPANGQCGVGGVCNQEDSSLATGVPYGHQFELDGEYFVGPEHEADLAAEVAKYLHDKSSPVDKGHGTFTYEALMQAKNAFDDIADSPEGDNARYVMILLADGEVAVNTKSADGTLSPNPILIAQDFDAYIPGTAGYELYTATIGDLVAQVKNMKNLSSNSYDGRLSSHATNPYPTFGAPHPKEISDFNGVDYAYAGDSETEMAAMYKSIIDSIVQIAVTIVSENNGAVVETSGMIEEGDNVSLPWPQNFVCNNLYPQEVPIKISFPGVGQVKVSNVRLNYCAP